MKSKSIVLMAVSLGFGLVAAIGISQVMGRNNSQPQAPKQETRPIMVALDHLDAHGELTKEKVAIENWPANLVPPDAISSFEEAKDKLLNCRVAKKMPILKQMVVNRNEINRLAIPKNYKVLGVKLPADDVIGGLLSPGDVVDLIGVFTNDKVKVSRTFLTNIRVFSVNNKTAPDQDRGKTGSQGAIVGVLLTRGQAEKLILAQKVAQIKLVLRSEDNDPKSLASAETENPDGVTTADFSSEDKSTEIDKPEGVDRLLGNLLSGKTESNVVHEMVMVTPDGPVSYVFHKDSPIPERVDGYTAPANKAASGNSGDPASAPANDAGDNLDSVDSGTDAAHDDEPNPAAESDSADDSDSAVGDQEDQFNAP